MAKKFFSFLGTSDYVPCKYRNMTYTDSEPEKYIQMSTLRMLNAQEWNEADSIVIFMTEDSKNRNWLDNGHQDKTTKQIILNDGLEKRLNHFGTKAQIMPVIFPIDGRNEQEIWQLFSIMISQLQEDDEVYIDVTHAFRYIPILFTVLSQYARHRLNIHIKSITYGNFEARDQSTEIAPIIDLTVYSFFMELSDFAYQLRKFGYAVDARDFTKDITSELGKLFRGQNEALNKLNQLIKNLQSFSEDIFLCNGEGINKGNHLDKILKFSFDNPSTDNNIIQIITDLFKPIVNEIQNIFPTGTYNAQENTMNCLYSAGFCLNKNLIQQAATLLNEGIIAHLLEMIENHESVNYPNDTNSNHKKYLVRYAIISSLLNVGDRPPHEWTGHLGNNVHIGQAVKNKFTNFEELVNITRDLSQIRNALNHAHFGRNNPGDYKENLMHMQEKVLNILMSVKN
ncbi:MAG: TM1812 family CRISPR-associated protein [Thermaurantimonas sp.]|uniref:TM1812 family CRISPR-associated protein n=1 Tax=Thermaurantimonas sp. TaxID=2681568 RepID=UPI00391CB4B7